MCFRTNGHREGSCRNKMNKAGFSPLRAGIGARLALAGIATGLLWFAVAWALI